MRIGLVRRGYSATGGAENYLRRLGDALWTRGHKPVLFASPEWPQDRLLKGQEFVPVAGRTPHQFAEYLAAQNPKARCDKLFSLERVRRCDCYRVGDGVHRAWLERRARAEPWWQPLLRRLDRKHQELLRLEDRLFTRGGAGQIIANSELVRREIVVHYGTDAERIAVVHNGLPAEHFRPVEEAERSAARAALALAPDDYAILFAGTGWMRKGLAYALRALDKLPGESRPVLLVAGRGNPRRYLWGLPAAARRRVRFLGPVKDMRALYAAADVFAAPTLYDPFSNACLEALATGLPVLTTRANGFAEIITPGVHGEALDTFGPDLGAQLAAALQAWSDPEKRRVARPRCAARGAEFTIERNVEETLGILLAGG